MIVTEVFFTVWFATGLWAACIGCLGDNYYKTVKSVYRGGRTREYSTREYSKLMSGGKRYKLAVFVSLVILGFLSALVVLDTDYKKR